VYAVTGTEEAVRKTFLIDEEMFLTDSSGPVCSVAVAER
jgi:hypothetical protein